MAITAWSSRSCFNNDDITGITMSRKITTTTKITISRRKSFFSIQKYRNGRVGVSNLIVKTNKVFYFFVYLSVV